MSDNGPQQASQEFSNFANSHGFIHVISGETERAVRTVKQLLDRAEDPYAALFCNRSSLLANGYSPAELLMSRNLRTKRPVTEQNL